MRPLGDIRVGIMTMSEKWATILDAEVSFITQDHLSVKYPAKVNHDNLLINSACFPTEKLVRFTSNLKLNQSIIYKDELIAARLDKTQFNKLINNEEADEIKAIDISNEDACIEKITSTHQIFTINSREIERDFKLLTQGRTSQPISETNKIIGDHPIFFEEGVVCECTIFNTQSGPIYIGKDCLIMEGSMIRGPFAMGEKSVIKMGARIYGGTTLGPGCKVGGEVQNVVFQANSNKGHDGYLGNSVIGEWCNFGAGTNNSNLKNSYDEVKLWSYVEERFLKTGLQFCGLIMGDHSKCAISTTFNTGTVVGVSANIFGSGFPRNFIPSFSWGGPQGYSTYDVKKAIETAKLVMERRGVKLTPEDIKILEYTYFESARWRNWE
jgi:UDP-N-acetylglucosamine diphosphorylase/glucosamine-1-phosphate N-acetyltransferase